MICFLSYNLWYEIWKIWWNIQVCIISIFNGICFENYSVKYFVIFCCDGISPNILWIKIVSHFNFQYILSWIFHTFHISSCAYVNGTDLEKFKLEAWLGAWGTRNLKLCWNGCLFITCPRLPAHGKFSIFFHTFRVVVKVVVVCAAVTSQWLGLGRRAAGEAMENFKSGPWRSWIAVWASVEAELR